MEVEREADFARRYVTASLRLGKHVDGLVDSYFGPQEIADSVNEEHLKPLGEILVELEELRKEIAAEEIDEMRKTFLLKQIKSLQTHTRDRMGARIPYREYVSSVLDIEPRDVKEQEIADVRRELETLLKKKGHQGNLSEMLQQFRKKRLISGDRLAEIFYNLVAEAKAHTEKVLRLPPEEKVEFDKLVNQPYSSDNKYLGNYKSLIRLNVEMPLTYTSLPYHVTHQTYPGHHTEHVLKEQELYVAEKKLDSSILMVNTPECTMSEGLAETSARFILGEPSMMEDRIQHLADDFTRAVRANAALMIHEKRITIDEAKKYFVEEGAYEKKESEQGMRFVLDPLWRAYLFTYYEGGKLISEAWKHAKETGKEEQLLQIMYKEENCPTTFREKVKILFK